MPSPSKKQTVAYLTRRFAQVGLEPNRRHGQNFLIDYNLIELLARSARLSKQDVVLEVGTGTGALTALIAPQVNHVVTVELDQHLFQIASEELEPFENVTMLQQDALKSKNKIHPNVLEAVKSVMTAASLPTLKLVANLPYNIATPLISNLLRCPLVPATMTVTIQREMAERITARPGTKNYGALSVWVQSLCETELVRILSPTVFWPRPKVESAMLQLRHQPEWRARIPDIEFFHRFVRSMFFHRRKFLRSVAISAFKKELTKPQVDQVLAETELEPNARTEELSVEELQSLCERFRQQLLELGIQPAGL